MNSLLKFLLPPPRRPSSQKSITVRDLIRRESIVGSRLFGIVRPGHRREFFCLDETTWVWHEEWLDSKNRKKVATTRYELHGRSVIKYQTDQQPAVVYGEELSNLADAIKNYYYEVADKVYNRPIPTA